MKKDYEKVDFALDKQKQTLLSLKQSVINEKNATESEDYKAALQKIIEDLEQEEQDLRNARELQQSGFENLDQKTNQLYTSLSNIMKTMHETQKAALQNLK